MATPKISKTIVKIGKPSIVTGSHFDLYAKNLFVFNSQSKKQKKKKKKAITQNDDLSDSDDIYKELPGLRIVQEPGATDIVQNENKQITNPEATVAEAPKALAVCEICKEEFESKVHLFTHVKESGHVREKLKAEPTKAATSVCEVCKEEFESRNQLFAHINEKGHARLKVESAKQVKNSTKKSKQKK